MEHELKTYPEPFAVSSAGVKRFEYRKNDRDYEVGDTLYLREWDPMTGEFTGCWLRELVTYVLRGPDFGVPEGFAILSTRGIEAGYGPRKQPSCTMRAVA